MKLFYASGSPYARIVRVVVRELGLLGGAVEEVEVTLRDPHSALLPYNPGGKVPALQLDNGAVLNESLLILAYLDGQHGGGKLLPMDGSDGWRILSELGRAYAFLDAVTVWNRELRFGLSAPAIIALEKERADRAADALEATIASGGYSGSLSASQIVLAAALENFARRHKIWDWQTGRPRLSRLVDEIAARPSFTATVQPELNV